MPTPNKGESERDYLKRCVPQLIHEGKPHDQAIAACYGMFDQHKKKMEMSHAAIVFAGDSADFRDAVVLGQGLPLEKDGQPVKYFWKEVLRPGAFQDKNGIAHTVTPQRIENLVKNFERAKAKGFLPCLPSRHEKDGASNFGFVVGAKKNDKGGLELLNQFIGDDAIKAAARNKSSICTIQNYTDETGETFDELIDHNAIVPDPQLSNLDDFRPALAASRGTAASAVVLSFAASEVNTMDLSKLREAIGAGKEISDETVLTQACAKIADLSQTKSNLELNRTNLSTENAALKSAKEAAEKKVLELSQSPASEADVLREAGYAQKDLDYILRDGKCTPAQAAIVKDWMVKDSKPTPNAPLMFSRGSGGASPFELVKKVLELNKPFTGTASGSQMIDPNVGGSDEYKQGLAEGQAARQRDLNARGIAAA